MKIYGVSKEYQCPLCGKVFYVPYQSKGGGRTHWLYKIRIRNKYYYLCSYTCWRSCECEEGRKTIKEKEVAYK